VVVVQSASLLQQMLQMVGDDTRLEAQQKLAEVQVEVRSIQVELQVALCVTICLQQVRRVQVVLQAGLQVVLCMLVVPQVVQHMLVAQQLGWLHLCSVPALQGGQPVLLTDVKWRVVQQMILLQPFVIQDLLLG